MTATHDEQLPIAEGTEWLVGVVPLPTYITENGTAYRPSAIVWLDAATELILGTTIVPPEGALAAAAAHLRTLVESGAPGRPGRIRVASPELADVLRRDAREALEAVDVVCAPTPELDEVFESLIERIAPDDDEEPDIRYLGSDATVEGTAAMFRAAARLYAARPWEIVPSDTSLLGITSEQLGLRDAVISVIGQAGQVHGFILFASLSDFHQFGDAADRSRHGQPVKYPCHLALTYAPRADVGPALLSEIATHRWKVAGPRAVPVITAIDEDAVGRNPTRNEMLCMETLAAMLAEIIGKLRTELEEALGGESTLTFHDKVETSGGEIETAVLVPVPGHHFDNAGDAADADHIEAYRNAILARFETSPEARGEPAAHWGALLVDYAASHFATTVESLSPAELRELVFEVFPRKVSVDPEAAPAIVAGLRALLAFVRRECPDSRAEACLACLEGNASQRLARLLADSSSFGPAKAFVMAGRAAGFDMSTQTGTDAWIAHMRRHDIRLPLGFPAPTAAPRRNASAKPPPSRGPKKTKTKTKRKAQRAARTKSRSR